MNKFAISTLMATVLLSACGSSDDKKTTQTTKVDKVSASVFSHYKGVWERRGTGDLWTFDDEKFTRYSFNSFGCIKDTEVDLSDIEGFIKYLSINHDKTQMTLDSLASSKASYKAIAKLPESCKSVNLLTQTDLPTNFEFLWHSINDYYAFFALRDIDWQGVYDEYRPQITSTTTKDEFFEIVDDMFSEFGDTHLSLSDGEELEVRGSKVIEFVRSVTVDANEDFGKALDELERYNDQVILSLLQDSQLHRYQNNNAIRWGKLSDNIGYIRIVREASMNPVGEEADNFLEQLALTEQDLEDTDTIMQAALSGMDNTDALIIDLRFNFGGFDNVSLKIASYFNDLAQAIGSKSIKNNNFESNDYVLNLAKSPIDAYTKPVYVITGRATISAGETLSMALKALPQVTLIGEATNGSVSDALEHSLPNGWQLTLSNEVYTDSEGTKVESIGVTPDVEMSVYGLADVVYGSDTPIDYVLQTVGAPSHTIPSKIEVDAAFEQYFKPTKIPGIAVAVIKDDRIVYQQAYGFANIAQEIAVTMDTPFNIASISKTILATGIMQKVEKGEISLMDELTEMNLSFDPNNPLNQNDGITLRHLVTHTSGIRDSEGYYCSYFVHESGVSLSQLFIGEGCPENTTTDPTIFFANDYFNKNGRYVMDGVHGDDEKGLPDTTFLYSNIASGLAGYAVEQKLNIDFADAMKQSIFMPLNMNNTAWRYSQLSATNPKAVQYTLDEDLEPIELPEYSYPTVYEGDLNASANDLAKFLITIINGGEYQGNRILNQASVDTMLSSQTDVPSDGDVQGVFWVWNGAFVGHNGDDPGASARMQYNSTTNTGIVVLMNGEDSSLGKGEVEGQLLPLMSMLYRYGLGQ
ncbi:serine hydrolase [Shewanella sp. VB17]|uniref:serine hydrolase n=1 Tax=Shewanella sp. VB17 TaxID=2739432 RepID=UPI0015636A06|nr:serine hydrolase [Shewanella sp. VB17]NRD75277.1 serine hydrolase [Shewanella sp. VB17]